MREAWTRALWPLQLFPRFALRAHPATAGAMLLLLLLLLLLPLPLPALASGTGEGTGDGVQWLRMTHSDFLAILDANPEGFTLVFTDAEGQWLGREYHSPDLRVYLEFGSDRERITGQLALAEGDQFCYRYPSYSQEFCWLYFQSEQGFMEESTTTDEVDFFAVVPGNVFVEDFGTRWSQRFD